MLLVAADGEAMPMWMTTGVGTGGRRRLPTLGVALIVGVLVTMTTVLLPNAGAQEPDVRGDVDAGREVFANNCAACHGASAEGRGAAPALVGVYDRHTTAEVETVIREGQGQMPAFGATLDDAQIDDVMAFLGHASDAQAQPRHGPHMHRWWDDMMWNGAGGMAMVIWMVFGLLLIVLFVVGVVWLVRQMTSDGGRTSDHQPPSSGSASGSAREDLDRRYARGEINREQYRAIRDDLEG